MREVRVSHTRRDILGGAVRAAAAMACGYADWLPDVAGAAPAASSQPTTGQTASRAKSIVADMRTPRVLDGLTIHETLLCEMIDEGVRLATASASITEGVGRLLKAPERVAIKVDPVGYEAFRTTDVFVTQLVRVLEAAGVAARRVMLVDAPPALTRQLGTRVQPTGWDELAIAPSDPTDRLAAWIADVDAIINVPFLKTHRIAGIAGCVFNMSVGIVRHPKHYYAGACTRAADVLALPQARSKLRLNIVNGLRAGFDGGPLLGPEDIWPHGGILVSTDPVAADCIAADIIDEQRKTRRLAPLADGEGRIPHVHAAALAGLGTDDPDDITHIRSDLS
jgi:hypothetical protein